MSYEFQDVYLQIDIKKKYLKLNICRHHVN